MERDWAIGEEKKSQSKNKCRKTAGRCNERERERERAEETQREKDGKKK